MDTSTSARLHTSQLTSVTEHSSVHRGESVHPVYRTMTNEFYVHCNSTSATQYIGTTVRPCIITLIRTTVHRYNGTSWYYHNRTAPEHHGTAVPRHIRASDIPSTRYSGISGTSGQHCHLHIAEGKSASKSAHWSKSEHSCHGTLQRYSSIPVHQRINCNSMSVQTDISLPHCSKDASVHAGTSVHITVLTVVKSIELYIRYIRTSYTSRSVRSPPQMYWRTHTRCYAPKAYMT
jgi:hypothetical protein